MRLCIYEHRECAVMDANDQNHSRRSRRSKFQERVIRRLHLLGQYWMIYLATGPYTETGSEVVVLSSVRQ